MRGGALPPALLCAALGLGLASADSRVALAGLAVLAATACVIAFMPVPEAWSDAVFLGCWASILTNAAVVHRRRSLAPLAGLAVSLNAGIWTGAVIALAPSKLELFEALPWALGAWPAAWMRRGGREIVLKVLASWLIAVAVLAATLQFLPVTPGYRADHME